jgi:hypothetical protein
VRKMTLPLALAATAVITLESLPNRLLFGI